MSQSDSNSTVYDNVKQMLYENLDYGIVIIGPSGEIVAFNEYFQELTGFSQEEIIGKSISFFNLDSKAYLSSKNRNTLQSLTKRFNLELKTKNKGCKWISVFEKPKLDAEKNRGSILFIEELSGQIDCGDHFEMIHDLIHDATIFENDLQGYLRNLHLQLSKVFPVENLLISLKITKNTLWFPYIHDVKNPYKKEFFRTNGSGISEYIINNPDTLMLSEQQFIELSKKVNLSSYEEPAKSQIIVPIRKLNKVIGTIRCFSYEEDIYLDRSKVQLLTEIGKRIGVVVDSIRNNSERSLFFELSDIPVMIVNHDGYFEYVNPSFLSETNYVEDELLKSPIQSWIHKEDLKLFDSAIGTLSKGKVIQDIEFRILCEDGDYKWFSWFAQTRVSGISYFFIGRDISNQKREIVLKNRLNKRLSNLIHNLKEGIFFVDKEGKFVHVNNDLCKMLGHKQNDLIGKSFDEILQPSHSFNEIKNLFDPRKTVKSCRFDSQFLNKSNQVVWVNQSLTPEFDEFGEFEGVFGILTNVSKERAEKQRKERLFRLHRSFFDLNNVISKGYDLPKIMQSILNILHTTYKVNVSRIYRVEYTEDLKFEPNNLAVVSEKLMLKSSEKLMMIFPDGISHLRPGITSDSPYKQVIDHQNAAFLIGKEKIERIFYNLQQDPSVELYKAILSHMVIETYALFPVIHLNKVHYLIECVSEKLMDKGETDDLSAFMFQVNVLISKKLGDIDLMKNEKKWRGLIENSSEITCIIDTEGLITFVSPSVKRMLGYEQNSVLDQNIFEFVHPEDRHDAEEKFQVRLKEGGTGFYQTLRIRCSTGEYKFFRVFTSNHLNKEAIKGLIVNAQDITDMVNSENEKYLSIIETEENERKRISRDLHDGVGQYLAATNMYMNLLEMYVEDQLNDEAKDLFQKAAEILKKATIEVRSVSHNIMPPSLKDFGFTDCVKGLVEGLSYCSGDIQFKFIENVDETEIPEWMGLTLFRAIQQIIHNAMTHGKPSEIAVSVKVNNKRLQIEITDNGIGFDPTEINVQDGIGILSIRQRIQSVGGSTMIKSQPNKGTTFTINTTIP